MITISRCPKCRQEVTIPPDVDLASSVRCPLCEAKYSVRDALPPLLVPLGQAKPTAPAAEEPQPEDREVAAEPDDEEIFAFLGEDEGTETPPAAAEETSEEEGAPIGPDFSALVEPEEGPAVGAGSAAGAAMFPAGEVPAETAGAPAAPTSRAPARPRRKQKSLVKELVGVVVGGVVGLSLGYWGLNFFVGERMDFLGVYLPGVAHTQNNWPLGDGGGPGTSAAEPGAPVSPEGSAEPGERGPSGGPGEPSTEPFEPPTADSPVADSPAAMPSPDSAPPLTEPAESEADAEPQKPAGPGELTEPEPADELVVEPPADFEAAPPGEPGAESKAETDAGAEAEPRPRPPHYVGPKDPPSFTASDVNEALTAARRAVGGLGAGDRLTAEQYLLLRRLAQRLTFLDLPPADSRRADCEKGVAALVQRLVVQPGRFAELGRWGSTALDSPEKAGGGLVISGVAGRIASRKNLFGTSVAPPGGENVVTVLANRPLTIQETEPVVVLGTIVTEPRQNMIGYPGSKDVIVWSCMEVPVPRIAGQASALQ